MKETTVGLIAIIVGLGLTFWGYRLARIVIPLWGLLAGFTIGASMAASALGQQFIGSDRAVIVSLVVGVVFALLAYAFYKLAVVLLGAGVGYWVGTSCLALIGYHGGVSSVVIGIVIGALFGIVTVALNIPKYFLIIMSALGGALSLVAGVLFITHQVPLDTINYAASSLTITISRWWSLLALLLFLFGNYYQLKHFGNYHFKQWGATHQK